MSWLRRVVLLGLLLAASAEADPVGVPGTPTAGDEPPVSVPGTPTFDPVTVPGTPTSASVTVPGTLTSRLELPPLDHFLVRPRVREAVLSPEGRRVAYLLREPHGSSVHILDLDSSGSLDGSHRRRFDSRLAESLWWSTDGTGLVIETPDRLAWLPADEGRARWIVELDADRKQRFLGVDPIFPHHLLVSEQLPPGQDDEEPRHRLLRIDAQGDAPTATAQALLERAQSIRRFLLDEHGEVRYLKWADGPELVISRIEGTSEHEILRCDPLDACTPVAFTHGSSRDGEASTERLWMMERAGGDLWQLTTREVRLSQEGPPGGPAVALHRDPMGLADLRTVHLDPSSGRPLLAVYDSDRHRTFGLDPATEASLARLREQKPGARLEIDARTSGPWLVEESGPRTPHARFHLYDPRTGALREILGELRRPEYGVDGEPGEDPLPDEARPLPAELLVEPRAITWTASDGLPVHGLVYVPPGMDPAEAPMVARIHGGPWNHVRRQWSVVSQFLVNRGYIVFEPNFRSSTGFGLRHVVSAEGDFGDGRVQLDILEGLDHLHAQGLGHPDRVAVIGHSFGGFSTLGALAFTPRRFVAGVASAPPIDLVRAIRDLPDDHRLPNGLVQKDVVSRLLGDLEDPRFVAELRRQSPEAHLAATERPLLVLAGGADAKVDIVDVRHYATALHNLGKDISLLVDEEQGHSFEHEVSIGAYLYLLERFLGHHLGGGVGPVRDPRIADYIETRLELEGPSLEAILGDSAAP